MKKPIRLFIADDHQLFIDGIKSLLESSGHIQIVGEANNGNQLIQKLKEIQGDIILMDIGMPELDGIETTKLISEKYPDIKILALTMYDDNNRIVKMMNAGVKGYILKNTSKKELVEAIETVADGKTFYSNQVAMNMMKRMDGADTNLISKLTKREIEVIKLIVKSMTNKEIAAQLFLSELTVKTHRQNVMQKLGVVNTAGLVKFAMDNNFPDL